MLLGYGLVKNYVHWVSLVIAGCRLRDPALHNSCPNPKSQANFVFFVNFQNSNLENGTSIKKEKLLSHIRDTLGPREI